MDNVVVPEEAIQYLIGQTEGSTIQHEQVLFLLGQRVMTAPAKATPTAAPLGLGVQVSGPQPLQLPAMASTPLPEPKVLGLQRLAVAGEGGGVGMFGQFFSQVRS